MTSLLTILIFDFCEIYYYLVSSFYLYLLLTLQLNLIKGTF